MTEGLDLYDDVLTTSGPVEDEALQSHVCKNDLKNTFKQLCRNDEICLPTLSYVVGVFASKIHLLFKLFAKMFISI